MSPSIDNQNIYFEKDMSSILDPDFLEISELKMENQRLRNQLIVEQNKYNGLSNVVCKWIELYGENYIQIPKSSAAKAKGAKGPYISGAMCTDLRLLIDNIVHGNISVEQAYIGLFMAQPWPAIADKFNTKS